LDDCAGDSMRRFHRQNGRIPKAEVSIMIY
jgi:hypothetical protein